MHKVDWDSLFPNQASVERDAIVAYLFHLSDDIREEEPVVCFYLRRAAEHIIEGRHRYLGESDA